MTNIDRLSENGLIKRVKWGVLGRRGLYEGLIDRGFEHVLVRQSFARGRSMSRRFVR